MVSPRFFKFAHWLRIITGFLVQPMTCLILFVYRTKRCHLVHSSNCVFNPEQSFVTHVMTSSRMETFPICSVASSSLLNLLHDMFLWFVVSFALQDLFSDIFGPYDTTYLPVTITPRYINFITWHPIHKYTFTPNFSVLFYLTMYLFYVIFSYLFGR